MTEFLRRYSLQISGIILLVCSLQLMSLSIANPNIPRIGVRLIDAILSPVGNFQHEVVSSADALWEHYLWLVGVEEERNDLLNRVKQLEETNSKLLEFQ